MVILVPLDGSKNALRAVQYAIDVAKRGQTMVHVLNVQQQMDDYGTVPAYVSKRTHREFASERAKAVLEPALERLRRARVRHAAHIVYGDVAPSIARTAQRLKCDSIVMGTRGMGAIGNLLLGSVANKVIHLAKAPVTLIK
jgi:nucleotide-binding universal stress UspA family protein